ncbi:MAG: bifunctional sulfate adenylyltransferase/adenylylsulfate kinase [Bacteroidetes bacterium]|nr:adenylyltransferase [Rhodothermaceae bacterium RA]RMH53810.1 MAG: bifunctional sulfate adenylyltransferase/adenylylsulfate kinase [Bacteroidota bacterium]
MTSTELIKPHGGELCDLMLTGDALEAAREAALHYPSITLTERQLCDIELLLNGGFSPLRGFLGQADYDRVVEEMRLTSGDLWPMPITLDVDEATATSLSEGDKVALRDPTGLLLAVLTVSDVWQPDKQREAEKVFGTTSQGHPAVHYLMNEAGSHYVGGTLEGIQLPIHYDFHDLRRTPREMRALFEANGWDKVVAFQTRNPMHRAHKELTDRAAEEVGGHLLIHPVVGMTKPGDVDYFTRVRCYKKLLRHYPEGRATISLLPLAMRMGGPREAVWHAIIRKNYGCTHFIVGRDHAGPGKDTDGTPFYGPYDAQELVIAHQDELGIQMVPFRLMVYVPERDAYEPIDEVQQRGDEFKMISGTQLRQMLAEGAEIPSWFSYEDVVAELRRTHPPRHKQGFTVFFTGLSGSGKSTVANALMVKLLELGGRPVTLLDGDVVRTHLSKGLGFSREDRSINVQRIGFVASEITKHGGIAICAPIAPYEADRRANRQRISDVGGYIEVFVDTPLEVCEARDVKGLYAKARAGIIKGFTGIDDPYEVPENPEIVVKTAEQTIEESAQQVFDALVEMGYLRIEDEA